MINILIFLCFFVTCGISQRVYGIQNSFQDDVGLERQLNLINKPPVKSIQTELGYIVDCIDINKQPAFDHPLLKNHKLQRKPSNPKIVENPTSLKDSPSKPLFGLERPCPRGTVPIRRITKSDLIKTQSLSDAPLEAPGIHVAGVRLKPQKAYYGVSGTANVWNPKVDLNQSSAAFVWVRNGETASYPTNEISAGWHVEPQLYNGDFTTFFFARWTADNYRTGCYNLLCKGFMQIDNARYLGGHLYNVTDYNRNLIREIQVSIYKDQVTNNWMLNVDNAEIGYFPAELFSNLSSAEQVGWGGRTTTQSIINPPMGSGTFPNTLLLHSSYFRFIGYKNESRFNVPEANLVEAFSDNPKCYGANYLGYYKDNGHFMLYGGPGGYCDV